MATGKRTGAASISNPHAFARWLGHRATLPRGLRDRLIRRLCHPDQVPSTPFEVAFFGQRYPGDLSCFLDWEVYFYGAYERHVLQLLDELARAAGPACRFVDIGANIGHHTLYMASRGVPVLAIEPWTPVRSRLLEKIALNRLSNVRIVDCALGERDERRAFFAPTSGNSGTGSLFADANAGHNAPAGEIEVRRADTVMAECGITAPAVLKIDVEGAEAEVLAGMPDFLDRQRPAIVLESSPGARAQFTARGGVSALLPSGYHIEAVERQGEGYRLAPCDPASYDGMLLLRTKT